MENKSLKNLSNMPEIIKIASVIIREGNTIKNINKNFNLSKTEITELKNQYKNIIIEENDIINIYIDSHFYEKYKIQLNNLKNKNININHINIHIKFL